MTSSTRSAEKPTTSDLEIAQENDFDAVASPEAKAGVTESTLESSDETDTIVQSKYDSSWIRRVTTPKNCRWDDKSPPALTMAHCLLYAMVRPLVKNSFQ